MPYPRHFTFQRWKECDVCGFDWPLPQLTRDYTGLLKCPRCYDQKGFEEYREDTNLPMEEIYEEDFGEEIL